MVSVRRASLLLLLGVVSSSSDACSGASKDGECMAPASAALMQAKVHRSQEKQSELNAEASAGVKYVIKEICSPSMQIMTADECEAAAGGKRLTWVAEVSDNAKPGGCGMDLLNGGKVSFNTHAGGANPMIYSICMKVEHEFAKMETGSNGCTSGSEVSSFDMCRHAASALHLPFEGKADKDVSSWPRKCWVYTATTGRGVYWNNNPTG